MCLVSTMTQVVEHLEAWALGSSSSLTALVRFRRHIWPSVSTYLCKSLSLQQGWFMFTFYCPSKVQTAYLAYCGGTSLEGSLYQLVLGNVCACI